MKKTVKRVLAIALVVLLVAGTMCGCGDSNGGEGATKSCGNGSECRGG